jgi:hypothetical protein
MVRNGTIRFLPTTTSSSSSSNGGSSSSTSTTTASTSTKLNIDHLDHLVDISGFLTKK